jgi:probable phosphoglycerate mutase
MSQDHTTNVWFIRHGESMANAGEVAVDRGSTLLTGKGQEQAKDVSLKITTRPDLIVMTPYIRTHQTAQPLRERYPDVPCETWDLYEFSALSEDNYINRTWAQRTPLMRAYWERNDPEYVDGTGAESFSAMTQRINAGLARLRERPEKFIVVFAHGYIIQTTRLMLGKPGLPLKALMKNVPYYMEHSPIENSAIIRVEMDAQGTRIHEEDFKNLETGHAFEGD